MNAILGVSTVVKINLKIIAVLIILLLFLSCSYITQGYKIEQVSSAKFGTSQSVEIIREKPKRAFSIIATFEGNELNQCKGKEEFCQLIKLAKKSGADAAWIQGHTKSEQPGQWITYENKPMYIRPYTVERFRGVFIKFEN